MPHISVNTTLTLKEEQKDKIASKLGGLITLIPNKIEAVLMIDVSDKHTMYFAGKKMDSCAFVDVKCFKSAPFEANKAFTEAVFLMLKEELGLAEGEIYLSISEMDTWGTKGTLK